MKKQKKHWSDRLRYSICEEARRYLRRFKTPENAWKDILYRHKDAYILWVGDMLFDVCTDDLWPSTIDALKRAVLGRNPSVSRIQNYILGGRLAALSDALPDDDLVDLVRRLPLAQIRLVLGEQD